MVITVFKFRLKSSARFAPICDFVKLCFNYSEVNYGKYFMK